MAERLTRRLEDFLIEISQDPVRRQQLEDDPESMLAETGLSTNEIKLLMRHDSNVILAKYGLNAAAHMTRLPPIKKPKPGKPKPPSKPKPPGKKVAKKNVAKKK